MNISLKSVDLRGTVKIIIMIDDTEQLNSVLKKSEKEIGGFIMKIILKKTFTLLLFIVSMLVFMLPSLLVVAYSGGLPQ